MRGRKLRSNPTTRGIRVRRLAKALELMREGLTMAATAKKLGISRDTLWRNLRDLKIDWCEHNREVLSAILRPMILRARAGDFRAIDWIARFLDGSQEDEQ